MKSTLIIIALTALTTISLQAQSDISKLPKTYIKAHTLIINQEIRGTLDNSKVSKLAEAVWFIGVGTSGTFNLTYQGNVDIYLYVIEEGKRRKKIREVNYFPVDGATATLDLDADKQYVFKVFPSFGADEVESYALKLAQ